MPRKPFPCAICGDELRPGPRTAPRGVAAHAKCRGWKQRGSLDHGDLAKYEKHGCRCDLCKAAKRDAQREYVRMRREAGDPVRPKRKTAARKCDHCGIDFMGRLDSGQRFCSLECARDVQGRRPVARFKIARSVRLEIYEACGWSCQLCYQPVRADAEANHPRSPTLDHIMPRSRGGSDDRENLRLACRQCNTLRGTDVDWVPVEAVA